MRQAVRSYVRPDEKQFVFIAAAPGGYVVIETAELWEEPFAGAATYFFYPTVAGETIFENQEEAERFVEREFVWTAASAITPSADGGEANA